jgi:hypothetical protein
MKRERGNDGTKMHDLDVEIFEHPYGVLPEGNLLFLGIPNGRDSGLGVTMSQLPDSIILDVLSYLR